jgi:hypothetical protein
MNGTRALRRELKLKIYRKETYGTIQSKIAQPGI